MPTIHFECLMPADAAAIFPSRIDALSALLLRDAKITEAEVEHTADVSIDPRTLAQLKATYLADRGEDLGVELHQVHAIEDLDLDEHALALLEGLGVHRFSIRVAPTGSLSELAMTYSRLLTPAADLPADRMALENEEAFEQPALYPWLVRLEP